MFGKYIPAVLGVVVFLVVFVGGFLLVRSWYVRTLSLEQNIDRYGELGTIIAEDLSGEGTLMPLVREGGDHRVEDDGKDGLEIFQASFEKNGDEETKKEKENSAYSVSFPKKLSEPLEIQDAQGVSFSLFYENDDAKTYEKSVLWEDSLKQGLFLNMDLGSIVRYEGRNSTSFYGYKRDRLNGERVLKHWTVFEKKKEDTTTESYRIEGANIQKEEDGSIGISMPSPDDAKNKEILDSVDEQLQDRVKETLKREANIDLDAPEESMIMVRIPAPYVLLKNGERKDLSWEVDPGKATFSVSFDNIQASDYPIALDPTLEFTLPGDIDGGDAIVGENADDSFAHVFASGDFNADGREDIAIGAPGYGSDAGRVYILYNDGGMPKKASSADGMVMGGTGNRFGTALAVGDLNADGKDDLVVGAPSYNADQGQVYVFYGGNILPTNADLADIVYEGESSGDLFGSALTIANLNGDGYQDLSVGAPGWESDAGKVYTMYGGGLIEDAFFFGESSGDRFGESLATGDLKGDGLDDLVMGAPGYNSNQGKVYISYGEGGTWYDETFSHRLPLTIEASTIDTTLTEYPVHVDLSTLGSDFFDNTQTDTCYDIRVTSSNGLTELPREVVECNSTAQTGTLYFRADELSSDSDSIFYIYYGDPSANDYTPSDPYGSNNVFTASSGGNSVSTIIEPNNSNHYRLHQFTSTSSQNLTLNTDMEVEYLIVGGGGGGGDWSGGGGGAGGFLANSRGVSSGTHAVVVGGGGAKANSTLVHGGNGGNSSAFGLMAVGGGGGASGGNILDTALKTGSTGGSGGGGTHSGSGGNGTGGQGFSGGNGYPGLSYQTSGGGGGGAGETGSNGINAFGGLGGDGVSSSITGVATYYAGGGSGSGPGCHQIPALGGLGGGAGASQRHGTPNTGGGGVGDCTGENGRNAGNGGSGFVAVRYAFINDIVLSGVQRKGIDVMISGEASSSFSSSFSTGDLNSDGKDDLAVGAPSYSSDQGRVYIFHGGALGTDLNAGSDADTTITGEENNDEFGFALESFDANRNGRKDLFVGAPGYESDKGRAYIFYNDDTLPTQAQSADVIISGESFSHRMGMALGVGDVNLDGNTDMFLGAPGYDTNTGKAYILYSQNGIVNLNIRTQGEVSGDRMGTAVVRGDFNNDSHDDVAVSAPGYGSGSGRVYLFYGNGTYPETASQDANVTITGETASSFGSSLVTGDFNSDGKDDLAVSASSYNSDQGRVYIFYGGSLASSLSAGSDEDTLITGEASSSFGSSLATGDLNSDGKDDLAVGAPSYNSDQGRMYVFHGGAFGATLSAGTDEDVQNTGENTGDRYGETFVFADLNSDGGDDMVIGAPGYNSDQGKVYTYYGKFFDWSNRIEVTLDASSIGFDLTDYPFTLDLSDFPASFFSKVRSDGGDIRITKSDGATELPREIASIDTGLETGRIYFRYKDTIPSGENASIFVYYGNANATNYADEADFGKNNVYTTFSGGNTVSTIIDPNDSLHYRVHSFTSTGTSNFTAGSDVNAEYLVVAGGGGGGGYFGGGGGAGGMLEGSTTISSGEYPVVLGAGGARAANTASRGSNGGNSSAFGFVALGGGGGGTQPGTQSGRSGGSGGGGSNYGTGGSGTSGQGYSGGNGFGGLGYQTSGGGGGGAGEAGQNGVDGYPGAGGDGVASSITGVSTYYGGGGGGGSGSRTAEGGLGGGGGVSGWVVTAPCHGTSNTGGGGCGRESNTDNYSGNGGSGIVAVRYELLDLASVGSEGVGNSTFFLGESSGDQFGISLAVDDLNSDGKDDLAVGAPSYNTDQGRVYIFHGGTLGTDLNAGSDADTILDGETTSSFGSSLSIGDFNADGKNDLVVGAPSYNTNQGRVYVFYDNSLKASLTAGTDKDIAITGETPGDALGSSLASGDFNTDGEGDFVIGIPGANANTGEVAFFQARDDAVWRMQPVGGQNDFRTHTCSCAGQEIPISGELGSGGEFGSVLHKADIDGDGRDDMIVGARSYRGNRGRVYVFYNDGIYPSNASSADIVLEGTASTGKFGSAIASGDFNSDGRIDLFIGAPATNSNTGEVFVFFGKEEAPPIAQTSDVVIVGTATSQRFGSAIQGGDLNDDGTDDIVVGGYGTSANAGSAFLFYGGNTLPNLSSSADKIILGETFSWFGYSLEIMDLNDDGKDDLVVGAYLYGSFKGKVYGFYNDGSYPSGANSADVAITGENSGDNFGFVLYSGDILGDDGKQDLLVGAYGYPSGAQRGRVYVFANDGLYPSSAVDAEETFDGELYFQLFARSGTTGDFDGDGSEDLFVGSSTYNEDTGRSYAFFNDGALETDATYADIILTGENRDDYFGYSIMSGDFNADGRDDIVIGAEKYRSLSGDGKLYLYTFRDGKILGENAGDSFGYAIKTGDINGDGRDDIVVSATGYGSQAGRVYIFYSDNELVGDASGADVIIDAESIGDDLGYAVELEDVNGDGIHDVALGAPGWSTDTGRVYVFYGGVLSGTIGVGDADATLTGENAGDRFGMALTSGDIGDDGINDLVVSAPGHTSATGKVYLFSGNVLSGAVDASTDTLDAYSGENAGDEYGTSLSLGDLNQDGKNDILVGAPGYNSDAGRAYAFYGGEFTENISFSAQSPGDRFGSSLSIDDLNGDGKNDIAIGAPGYDSFTGRAYIFHGPLAQSSLSASADADTTITGIGINGYFGEVLSTGDPNGDGLRDLLVGASHFSANTGNAYEFYNDGLYPTNAVDADSRLVGGSTGYYYGWDIASGDIDGNGVGDVLVGALGVNNGAGRVSIIYSESYSSGETGGDYVKTKGNVEFKGTIRMK